MFRRVAPLRWLVVVPVVTALTSLLGACAKESQQPQTRRLELTIDVPYEGPRSVAEGTAAHEKVTAALRRDTERDEWVPTCVGSWWMAILSPTSVVSSLVPVTPNSSATAFSCGSRPTATALRASSSTVRRAASRTIASKRSGGIHGTVAAAHDDAATTGAPRAIRRTSRLSRDRQSSRDAQPPGPCRLERTL
jgi:hypothetical protein